jgi:hypothetical protein
VLKEVGMNSRTGIAGLVAAIVLAAVWIVPASSSASTWGVTTLRDDQVPGDLLGISCPSTGLCVATGSDSLVATSTDPTGGRTAWKTFHPGGVEEGPTEKAEELGKNVTFPGAQIRGVSCPSTGYCVAVSLDGRIFSSTDPTGGPAAWKIVPLGGEKEPHVHMTGVSCPSPALCVAVALGSKIVFSTNPTGDRSAWTVVELSEPLDLHGVSCPSVSLCVGVDNEGRIVSSSNPTGSAAAWGPAVSPAGPNSLNGIACPSVSFCVTGNAGQIITSTNPAASAWNVVTAGTGLPVKGVSCPALTACAAIDNNSDAMVSTNPTGGAAAWPFINVIPPFASPEGSPNGMFAISCPTTTLCAAAGVDEQIITSSDPFDVDSPEALGKSKHLRVVITTHPGKRVKPGRRGSRVAFRFHAIGVGAKAARFKCKFAGHGFRPCKSPRHYRVGIGLYTFRVRAVVPGGAKSPAASFHFRVSPLTESPPVGSCRPKPPNVPPGQLDKPCINAR